MATTYTWDIQKLRCEGEDPGVVTIIDGNIVGSDSLEDGTVIAFPQPFAVTVGPFDPDNFIPYADIDLATAEQWVIAELGGDRVRLMKATLKQTLTTLVAQATPAPLPWVQAPEAPPEGEEEPA